MIVCMSLTSIDDVSDVPEPDDLPADSAPDLPAHRQRRAQEPPRAIVLGGGPLGLEAALYARRLGHQVWLFEREPTLAPDVRQWAHLGMFTAWGSTRSPLGELALREAVRDGKLTLDKFPSARTYPTGGDFVRLYLEPLAALLGKAVHLETRAVALGRSYMFPAEHADDPDKRAARRFRLLTRDPREERVWTADYVFDATGVTHSPRWLGAGGLPALGEMGGFGRIFHHVPDVTGRDRIHFLGKRTLLVGDGTSAATTALALAGVIEKPPHGAFVWVSPSREPLPLALVPDDPLTRRDTLLKKANLLTQKAHPRIQFSPVTQVEAVQHSLATNRFQVTLQVNHETKRLTMDSVVSNVGYRRDVATYERVLHPQEPGVYVIGEKAAAPEADFLLALGRTQIRDAFRQVCGQPDLDLYAEAQGLLKGL